MRQLHVLLSRATNPQHCQLAAGTPNDLIDGTDVLKLFAGSRFEHFLLIYIFFSCISFAYGYIEHTGRQTFCTPSLACDGQDGKHERLRQEASGGHLWLRQGASGLHLWLRQSASGRHLWLQQGASGGRLRLRQGTTGGHDVFKSKLLGTAVAILPDPFWSGANRLSRHCSEQQRKLPGCSGKAPGRFRESSGKGPKPQGKPPRRLRDAPGRLQEGSGKTPGKVDQAPGRLRGGSGKAPGRFREGSEGSRKVPGRFRWFGEHQVLCG